MGLTPFEVNNALMSEVFDIYVNCIIHDKKNKQGTNKKEKVEWVTSQNATWR